MAPYPWELRDPAAVIDDVARQHQLRPGLIVAGLVQLPSTTQRLLDTTVIYEAEHSPADVRDCAWLAKQAAHRLFEPRVTLGPPQHSFVTIVVRNGGLDFEPTDAGWLLGWQHADHRLPVYTGELILFTEQGWHAADLRHDDLVGFSPVLVAA
jgi:hypothetical protein